MVSTYPTGTIGNGGISSNLTFYQCHKSCGYEMTKYYDEFDSLGDTSTLADPSVVETLIETHKKLAGFKIDTI